MNDWDVYHMFMFTRTISPNTFVLAISAWTCPYAIFGEWIAEAKPFYEEPNAMTIATVDQNGFPSARIVLLKEVINNEGTSSKFFFYRHVLNGCKCFWKLAGTFGNGFLTKYINFLKGVALGNYNNYRGMHEFLWGIHFYEF